MRVKSFIAIMLLLVSVSSVTYADEYYDTEPVYTAPYNAGKVKSSVLNEGLAELNLVREIIGLPHNVTLNDDYTNKAQHGAVLNDIIGMLDHTPNKPSDMNESFYSTAYDGTSHSNLSWGSGGMTLPKSIAIYMDDSDSSNITMIGHRRWIMNPRLQQTGFGLSRRGGFSALYVIEEGESSNSSTPWPISDEFIAWPSAKNPTPSTYMNPRYAGSNTVAWSVTLNPAIFNASGSSVRVKITRLSDNKAFDFDAPGSAEDYFFEVSPKSYNFEECIIFRPNGVNSYSDGEKWHVEITGLSRKDGSDGTITYDVTFGSFTGSSSTTTETNNEEETNEEIKNDSESLLPITGEETMNNLAEALKMDVEDINFITTVDSADITSSETAIKFAKDENFKITMNYATITAKTGYNAFKLYVNSAGILGKSASDIKIYLTKKSSVIGGSFVPSAIDEVIEAELFDVDGNKITTIPDPIIVAVDIDEAGDYSVHLAEKDTGTPTNTTPTTTTTSEDKTSGDKTVSSDSSSGCDSGLSVVTLLLMLGIPRVFGKRVGHK